MCWGDALFSAHHKHRYEIIYVLKERIFLLKKETIFKFFIFIFALGCSGSICFAIEGLTKKQDEPIVLIQEVVQEKIVEVPTGITPYYQDIAESITEEEIELLASVVRAEAGNQSFTGQKAVAEVVLNRVQSDKFPDSVQSVIYQEGQFSTAAYLDKYPPTEIQYHVVETVLKESEPVIPEDVMFFATYPFREVYEQIGDHYFCY